MVTPPKGSSEGRVCLDEYKQLGYIPQGCSDADVSRSMNYWHSDWALSQAATLLGTTTKDPDGYSYADDAAVLGKRAKNWVKLLDPKTGFFRTKGKDGAFTTDFDEFAWGPKPGYTEAGAWQYRVEVPYDPKGLQAELTKLGYDGCDIIQEANTMSSAFHSGGYGGAHELCRCAAMPLRPCASVLRHCPLLRVLSPQNQSSGTLAQALQRDALTLWRALMWWMMS